MHARPLKHYILCHACMRAKQPSCGLEDMPAPGSICMHDAGRGGTLYIQGDLGNVNVVGSEDGGIYLGASAFYPGSVGNVSVQLTGPGSLVVAASTREASAPRMHACTLAIFLEEWLCMQ